MNPKKVQLACSKVDLLGFIVGDGQLRPKDVKLRAIAGYPWPHDAKRLQRFLGMIAFYRSFIPLCAELTVPLTQLVRKRIKWNWGESHQHAFKTLTRAIAEITALKFPDLM